MQNAYYLLVLFHCVLLFTNPRCLAALSSSEVKTDDDDLSRNLVEWLRANGATISNKVEVRHVIPGDPTSPRGVFALDTLEEGEVLCSIPGNLLIQPEKAPEKDDWDCGTVDAVFKEMSKEGRNPYAKYLLEQPRDFLPAFWSTEGKDLLSDMLGKHLPPHDIQDVLLADWAFYCKEANLDDPLQRHAREMVLSRADYQYMIPFYDMLNHRCGKWYNTKHGLDDYYAQFEQANMGREGRFELLTSKKVQAGQELYICYSQCNICTMTKDWLGTPEMLSKYGFVEEMPQRWLFHYARLKFDLDWKDGDESSEKLQVKFFVPPSERGVRFLREELKRLQDFEQRQKADESDLTVPKSEWETIWKYHNALKVTMTLALDSAVEVTEEAWNRGRYWWAEDPSEPPEYADEVYYGNEMDDESNGMVDEL